MYNSRIFGISAVFATMMLLGLPARADVTYKFFATSVSNIDLYYDPSGDFSFLNLPSFTVTDAVYKGGSILFSAPSCYSNCSNLPPGVVSIGPEWGNLASSFNVSFDQADPYISGSISGGGFNSSFALGGTGNVWEGYIAGDAPVLGEYCLGTPQGTGCDVSGYFKAVALPVPEPSSIVLEITGLCGFTLLLWQRNRVKRGHAIGQTSTLPISL